MARWREFSAAAPLLADFAAVRLGRPPAYLATVRSNGSPRVHPITPIITPEGLYVFMEPTSPKAADLREREVFALHNGVPDSAGSGGEIWMMGIAHSVTDTVERSVVADTASYNPADRYVLFELEPSEVRCLGYGDIQLPTPDRWQDTD